MSLYSEVFEIARKYLGSDAEDYLKRRCRISFSMADPENNLEKEHIERLIEGIKMTAMVYLDQDQIRQFSGEISKLKHK